MLRGQRVYARANDRGELQVDGGRVEVRYRRDDGRFYRAAVRNLTGVEPELLPDETCGPAEPVRPKPEPRPSARQPRRRRAAQIEVQPELAPGAAVVYTDGACSSNPGPAGLGVVVVRAQERVELSEFLGEATNNIAELTAVLRALAELGPDEAALIHTDSKYTIGVVQQGWKAKRNAALVAQLRAELAGHPRVQLIYVPGHAGVALNERADQLARQAVAAGRSTRAVVVEEGDAS